MKVAITGGIGVGKSFVAKELEVRGIRVYDCDCAAKRLMKENYELRRKLEATVGKELYENDELQKGLLARFLLECEENKHAIDNIVHPYVAEDFGQSGIDWLESAILFEAHFDKRVKFDFIVCVTAPLTVRIQRIMQRDHISKSKAAEWIECQMPQNEMRRRSDFEIINDGECCINQQLDILLKTLTEIKRVNRNKIIV